MPNGRALPSAILFDELLGRAWARAQDNVNAATTLAAPVIAASNLARTDGDYKLKPFDAKTTGFDYRAVVREYDQSTALQLQQLEREWEGEMSQILSLIAPPGASHGLALDWLARTARGEDTLGYLGQNHRASQLYGMAAQIGQSVNNPRGLPMPAGAQAAMLVITGHLVGIALDRNAAQMAADRERERMTGQIEAAETLLRLRDEAIDAAIDYVNTQLRAVLDVYGENSEYRSELELRAASMRTAMQAATTALDLHETSVKQTHALYTDTSRRVNEINDRKIEQTMMLVDSYVKRMRRHSSRAASALNSAGVSVDSRATESNNISAEQ